MYDYLKSCVCLLLAALPVTSASCEKCFSKMKLVKTFPRNSMTSERLGNIDLLSGERYELKIDLDHFVDELTVDIIIQGLSFIEVMMIQIAIYTGV